MVRWLEGWARDRLTIRPSNHPTIVLLLLSFLSVSSVHAQLTRDFQLHGLSIFSSDRFLGGGLGYALRPPGRLRLGATVSAGQMAGSFAGRGEAFVSFHLNPGRETGFAPYASAGLAGALAGSDVQGYVQVALGLEQQPGRRTGFFVEAGLGGGFRVSAGYRFRSGSGIRRN